MTSLSFVGDISLGEHYFSFGHGPKTFSKHHFLFQNLETELNNVDYVIGNLEGPISSLNENPYDPESSVFRAAPEIINQLKKANINILNVANNHILQHGADVFEDTLQLLTQHNIRVIGKEGQPAMVLDNGKSKIALFGCSDVPDNKHIDQKKYQAFCESFLHRLEEAANSFDAVILFIHWGSEDTHCPNERQLVLEEKIRRSGVKFIIGHHPHIFYPIKMEKNFFCAYSLGDFIFDLPWDKKLLESGILTVKIDDKGELIKANILPVFLKSNGKKPTKTHEYIEIHPPGLNLYNHTSAVDMLQLKKFAYFSFNFFKGKTNLKLKFICNKILRKILHK